MAAVVFCGVGCSSAEDAFTDVEVGLITEGDGAMRVLKSDVPEDTVVLRSISRELTDGMIRSEYYDLLCRRMLETVTSPENDGVGIAGPQVGISRRVIAVQRFDKPGEPFEFYANPLIIRYGDETSPGGEGCLSVPSLRGVVERSTEIELQYRTLGGSDTLEIVSGFTAVIFQHEIDHLDGILYTDKAESILSDSAELDLEDQG